MATTGKSGKGHKEYGRRVRQPGGGGKVRGIRRVWFERPEDRCECHYVTDCPKAKKTT